MSQTHTNPGRGSPPSTPRWVKVFGIILIVLVLLFVILQIVSGGEHGPGRHMPSDGVGSQTPLSSVIEDHTSASGDLSFSRATEHCLQPL